jgi:maltose alpha-D-glucosyltransferase/alpha-amylase
MATTDPDRATTVSADVPVADPMWHKDAIVYELHVRSFRDSDGDGIGDFQGLTQKLPHLVDLGITAVWILPFYPSPGRDDGYDIADYRGVNPAYGTIRDVRRFIREAHRLGLRVITELVCNHTSDQHQWFQRARRARPGTRARNRYVWSDTAERYREARVIFGDFEPSNWSWDPVAGAYFWHRFYSHQPDLNFEEPTVHRDLIETMDFWLDMGVDGLRLDAIPYLYEREGTNCENLPETHAFLKALRRHVDERYPGRILLAEANQWPEKAVAYFGEGAGDECHMAFHFPVMPRLYMALRREDRYPIVDILEQTPPIPETSQWGMFLRNHDELTLEMVTDEERDFMVRVYAEDPQARINLGIRRRLAPLMRNDRRRIELLNGLLFSLPGTPFVYYGDEIGMGDNVYLGDRDGVRTPMQWSADANAGFSAADPARLALPVVTDPEYHYTTVNVATQKANPHSLLWWMKRLIALRKRHPAFGRGTMELLAPEDRRILAFLRRTAEERLLVVANLSRFVRPVELDLSEHAGWRPVELFGQTPFPVIGEVPYALSLAPHSFLWFELRPPSGEAPVPPPGPAALPAIPGLDRWVDALDPVVGRALGLALVPFLQGQAWFSGSLRPGAAVEIVDVHPFGDRDRAAIVLVRPPFVDGDTSVYQLPLAFTDGDEEPDPGSRTTVARTRERGLVIDPSGQPWFGPTLLAEVGRRRSIRGDQGRISVDSPTALREVLGRSGSALAVTSARRTRNVVLRVGDAYLKLYRRIEVGQHPELEIGRALRRAPLAGARGLTVGLEVRRAGAPTIIGGVGPYVAHVGSARELILGAAGRFIDVAAAAPDAARAPATALVDALRGPGSLPPSPGEALAGEWLETARLIGRRTAELHLVLADDDGEPAFAPEPFGELYQRSLYQAVRGHLRDAVVALQDAAGGDPVRVSAAADLARLAIAARPVIGRLMDHALTGARIRTHGDLRLEQFLDTGGDVVIVDFEGDPTRPLTERRIKRSPLHDIASVVASFVRVAAAGLEDARARSVVRDEDVDAIASRLLEWAAELLAALVGAYRETIREAPRPLIPVADADAALLLRVLAIDALARSAGDLARGSHDERVLVLLALAALVG